MANVSSCFGNFAKLNLYLSFEKYDDDYYTVSLESLILSFIIQFLKNVPKFPPLDRLEVNLVEETIVTNSKFKLHKDAFKQVSTKHILADDMPIAANCCNLPIAMNENNQLCVAGLCSVSRALLKLSNYDSCERLLGFRKSCLSSCSEVSIWTKFCESDILNCAKSFVELRQRMEAPRELLRFEAHMNEPLKTHNIGKIKHRFQQKVNDGNTLTEPAHDFAEGTTLSLADLIIFDKMVKSKCRVDKYFPAVVCWFRRMFALPRVIMACKFCDLREIFFEGDEDVTLKTNYMPNESLYIRDPKRTKPFKMDMKEDDLKCVFEKLENFGITPCYIDSPAFLSWYMKWDNLPRYVHPKEGDLPQSRLERKCHQLRNMAAAVLDIARDGDIIVDFCSGGGHLGILLAHLLPRCHVIMVENKEESISRLINRLDRLPNTTVYQSNVNYFKGNFNIGVALHACGTATDLVIQKCFHQRASFVICPCCYGSIRCNANIFYPRSKRFQSVGMTIEDHCLLGHAADQTHENGHKNDQGKLCMGFVDTDRLMEAEELNYSCKLFTMEPSICTLKNNVIVGRPQ